MISVRRLHHLLLLGTVATGTPFAQAYAQQAAPSPAPETQAAPDEGLATIVVTAQRRSESLQDVPVSITSVSGKALENSNFRSVTDLQYVVPGVQFDATNGAAFQIRGVGSTSFDYSNEKSVSLVVDDVVMDAQRDTGLTGLSDIQQIDVLMGPQGTLFGKNATSGVISVTTVKPVLGQFSAKGSASYGEREDRNATLTLNVPVGDTLALRVSGFDQGQEGYGRYTTLNQPLNSFKEYGYRAKLLFQPSDRIELTYFNDYEHHWDNFIRTSVSGALPAVTALQIANGVTPGPENDDDADSKMGRTQTATWGHSLRAQIKIGRDTLTSITAYRETKYIGDAPANLVPADTFAFLPYNEGTIHTRKVSQELRWASPTGGFVEYLGGLFYNRLRNDSTQLQWATLGTPLISSAGVPLTKFYTLTGAIGDPGNAARFKATNTSEAAFGQLKFNITPRASLAFSGRYTHDDNSQAYTFFWIDPLPITGVNATFTPTSAAPVQPFGEIKSDNFSYRIAGQYKLDRHVMLYATWSTGYKPGGPGFVGNNYSPYKDETVKSIEAGIKTELFDRRVRLNFDLFSSKFTNFQTSLVTFVPGNPLAVVAIGNAGGLKSRGAEATFAWRATDALTLSGGLTYTDARFTDYKYNATINYAGTRLTNAPEWQGNISATYEREIGGNLRLRSNLDYAYRSKVWTVIGQPAYSEIPGYGIANGRISLSPANRDFEFGIYGRNLFDTYYSAAFQQYSTLSLVHYIARDAHRTVGVFAKFGF
ncbi:TonB-dependent receptor [Sphingomonas sp. DC1600-2]|uniref:TonB-dependent receptor n=1 Tax=unclassified Sphingomonas TaxID=196159 RepID=UPI003CF73C2F